MAVKLPNFLKKKEPDPIIPITGDEGTEVLQPTEDPFQEFDALIQNEPEECELEDYDQEDIDDIVDQYITDLKAIFAENGKVPIPTMRPLDLSRAMELCSNATSGNVVNYLLMKQEEIDKAQETPWFIKYLYLIIIAGVAACLPVGIAAIAKWGFGN